jgi:hypothetical protein
MSGLMVYPFGMSDFPKHYEHKLNKNLPARVAYTPTEAVNLEARGYTVYEAPKADETKTDESNTGGGEQSADARSAAKKAASSNRQN